MMDDLNDVEYWFHKPEFEKLKAYFPEFFDRLIRTPSPPQGNQETKNLGGNF